MPEEYQWQLRVQALYYYMDDVSLLHLDVIKLHVDEKVQKEINKWNV